MTNEQRQFAERFARFQNRVYAFVLTIVPNRSDAEEVFQETVVILWEKWDQFDPARDFTSWGCGIARNVALRYLEKRERRFARLSDDAIEQISQEFEATQDLHTARLAAMTECLAEMPEKQRALLQRRYTDRETIREAAQQTQQTANAMYQRLRRLRPGAGEGVHGAIGTRHRGGLGYGIRHAG